VLGLKYIESISIKSYASLQIKFNKKEAQKDSNITYNHISVGYLSHSFLPPGHKVEYSFATLVRCREVLEGVEYLSRLDDDTVTLTDEGLNKVRKTILTLPHV
jgi:hypothetical protein